MQEIFNGFPHAGQIVALSGVGLVVDEQDRIRLHIVTARHPEHHDFAGTCLQTTEKSGKNLEKSCLRVMISPSREQFGLP